MRYNFISFKHEQLNHQHEHIYIGHTILGALPLKHFDDCIAYEVY